MQNKNYLDFVAITRDTNRRDASCARRQSSHLRIVELAHLLTYVCV